MSNGGVAWVVGSFWLLVLVTLTHANWTLLYYSWTPGFQQFRPTLCNSRRWGHTQRCELCIWWIRHPRRKWSKPGIFENIYTNCKIPILKNRIMKLFLDKNEFSFCWQGDRISMNEQLENYQTTVSQINDILGSDTAAATHLNKCLFTVGIGSNDYINNYLMPDLYPTSRLYTPDQYAEALIEQYSQQLKVSATILTDCFSISFSWLQHLTDQKCSFCCIFFLIHRHYTGMEPGSWHFLD